MQRPKIQRHCFYNLGSGVHPICNVSVFVSVFVGCYWTVIW